jgi:hypothetical protein
MKNKVTALGVVLILILSACAPQAAEATLSPLDVQQTAEAAAFTMVAQTQASIPTNTSIPPTETESPTPLPTLTEIASPTSDVLILDTPTGIAPTLAPLPTATTASGVSDACNKTLSAWAGPTVKINIVNETKPKGDLVVSLYVVTQQGECGYLADTTRGPVGSYSIGAFITGKQNARVFGSFYFSEGSWKVLIQNEQIKAVAGCYPSC